MSLAVIKPVIMIQLMKFMNIFKTKFKDIKYFRKQSDKKILVIISKEQSEVTRLKELFKMNILI